MREGRGSALSQRRRADAASRALAGLQSNFSILDTDDQLRVLKQLIVAANLDEKRWPARQLAGLIDRWKNRGWTPSMVEPGESEIFASGRGAELYAAYQDRLKTLNACDFGDLLLHSLSSSPGRGHPRAYRDRFKYSLVDEYHTPKGHMSGSIAREPRRNMCCVGDDDPSIYCGAVKGANILRFDRVFPAPR